MYLRAQELCESRGGRPGLSGLCERKVALNCSIAGLRSCVKVEVAVRGSLSLIGFIVSVDVKQHSTIKDCPSRMD